MNSFDEELQKSIETNLNQKGDDRDAAAYREVFRIISREPRSVLTSSLVDKVVKKIIARKKRETRQDFIWLSFGVLFLMTGLIVTAVLAGLRFEMGFLKEMSDYAGIFIFGVAVIAAFNWIEKRKFKVQSCSKFKV